ncbi:DUF4325 domain-containing protein [Halobacteriovorax sp. GB3]|uniref:STAS-like domain-containing protein n=1 Tax=Halobacteriovorax sp. GB3 TaxID=2719615 RepID=UPI00235F45EF|nr:DUF4325 domain-containing protein [Halobacteriovorax sp. GB3]MDD0853011.1 DUF4325 domain-containing protein [Halobacteriovorax sp. GB3]
MKIKLFVANQKMLSGRILAKSLVEKALDGQAYDEYELDFDNIEMVNQSFMNELVRSVYCTNPRADIFVSNCMSDRIRERFEKEYKFVKSVYSKETVSH